MTSTLAVATFVVSIIAAIMFHEYGHFWTARRFGMRADRFFLGFGPTVWSVRSGETEYGVKAIPAGGFVRIRGMSPTDTRRGPLVDDVLDPEKVADDRREVADREGTEVVDQPALPEPTWERLRDELRSRGAGRELTDRIVDRLERNLTEDATTTDARTVLVEILATEVSDTGRIGDLHHRLTRGDAGRFFEDRPAWQRTIVLSAGSISHFLVAVALLFVGYALLPQTMVVPVVEEVQDGSPADQAGLQAGDRILTVGDTTSDEYAELRAAIRARPGEPTTVGVERDGDTLRLQVTPEAVTADGERIGRLGFIASVGERRLSFTEAVEETFVGDASITSITVATVEAMGRVFGPEGISSIAAQVSGQEDRSATVGSIVGVANTAGQGTAMFGWMFLVITLVSVNVFVGVFNILPLPPLDGGHLAVLAVERSVNAVRSARGQPADFHVDPRTVAAIALPVIVLIGTLFVALLWLDITNPVDLQ